MCLRSALVDRDHLAGLIGAASITIAPERIASPKDLHQEFNERSRFQELRRTSHSPRTRSETVTERGRRLVNIRCQFFDQVVRPRKNLADAAGPETELRCNDAVS